MLLTLAVGAPEGNGSGESKRTVASDAEVVAAVILQLHATAVAEQADDLASNRVGRYGTNDLYVCDVRGACCTRTIAHGAVLDRTRGLRLDGDAVGFIAQQ